ncbi:response regulator transcription factor [Subtercola sp. RTI3]|uniref:helix-turn-helix transcriptional regulator n=1 Tax=Subtercola sp. RTI3 TaxID=3048639 RepID=UPI002B222C9E|nr:response regulator transcription factor [Subtercola sp. RTI3]MEA9983802.1 response regulator transcription factor [Subtercola sp. RTI3]
MSISTATHDLELLQKTLSALTVKAEFPLAFGGLVTREGAPLTAFVGTRGQTLNGLLIEPTEGLGGRAISERRPVTAIQYRGSTSITHRYDREVLAEHIVCLVAVPVVVSGAVRAVIYGAHRSAIQLGDPVLRTSLALATGLAWEYSVHDEVERRVALLETEGGAAHIRALAAKQRAELRDLYAELRSLSRVVADPLLAERLDAFGRTLVPRAGAHSEPTAEQRDHREQLSPRELDVLSQVALGKRNGHIADQLDLAESTVKSYLSSAMRKLDANNRYEAVITARQRGLIP